MRSLSSLFFLSLSHRIATFPDFSRVKKHPTIAHFAFASASSINLHFSRLLVLCFHVGIVHITHSNMVDFMQVSPLSFPMSPVSFGIPSAICDCADPFSSVLFTGDEFDMVPNDYFVAKSLGADEFAGDVVCTGCGVVRDRVISEDAEYRLFADSEGPDPRRVEKVDERFSMSTSIASTPSTSAPSKTNISSLIKTQSQVTVCSLPFHCR